MSTETVAAALGAGKYALLIESGCIRYGLEPPLEKAHFLAQVAHESQNFTKVRESLGYSAERLLAVFKGRNGLQTLAQARAIVARGQDAIAEAIYGGPWGSRNLGNTKPGDGAKYPGRSLVHVTGATNYGAYSTWKYGDARCLQDPAMLAELPDAVDAAFWYWTAARPQLKRLALADDLEGVTRAVNGGLNGLEDRRTKLQQAKRLFGLPA